MGRNFLEIPWLGRLLLSPWSFRLLRFGALLALLLTIGFGWHQHAIPGVEVPDPLMYTNLATHLVWVWWMMGVVLIALFFGRGWCAVCPVGWVNDRFGRIGLRRPLPRWLAGFGAVTLTLIVLQLAIYFLAVHRFPDYTAVLLAIMLLLAAGVGLVFRNRAFCSLFCPAGAVFGLYARVAPFRLRVQTKDTCTACSSKGCISGTRQWTRLALGPAVLFWHGQRSDCPAGLVPAELNDSSACHLCLDCVRNCDNANIHLGRRPARGESGSAPLSRSETLFFLVLLGLVTANFSKVYIELREALFWVPQQTALVLGWQATGYYVLATAWVSLILPLLLLLPSWLLLKLGSLQTSVVAAPEPPLAGRDASPGFSTTLGALALPFIPLVLTAHLILALVKLNAKAGYLPFVLRDPTGVKSYLAMNVMNTVGAPGVLIPLDLLKWMVLLLLFGGWLLAMAAARRVAAGLVEHYSPRAYLGAAAVGLTLTACLYGATILRWLFIR